MYVASMVSCFLASLERSLCDLVATDLQVLVVVSLHQRAGPGGRSKQCCSSSIHPLYVYTTYTYVQYCQDGTPAYFDRLSFLGYFPHLESGSVKLKMPMDNEKPAGGGLGGMM